MNYVRATGRILASACSIFTVILFVFFAGAKTVFEEPGLSATNALLCFVFALFFALANQFFTLRNISIIWRVTLHLVATLVDFIVVLFVFTGYYLEHGTFVVGAAILYIVAYALVATAIFFIRRAAAQKDAEQKPYQKQY